MERLQVLVSTDKLNEYIKSGTKDLRILDTTWYLPELKQSGNKEYLDQHIHGAVFFDIDECADKDSPYDPMLPTQAKFEEYVSKLGISNHSHIVVYDNSANCGAFSSPRVWWMFRIFGHESVSILDGGFRKWCSEGRPTTQEKVTFKTEFYEASFNYQMLYSFEDMEKNLIEKTSQVVDARGYGQFDGTIPDPRMGIKSGHIPGSINIPFTSIIDQQKKKIKSKEDLKKMFEDAGVDVAKSIIAMCGTGITACCLAFAGHIVGKDIPVYDGAWKEWYLRSQPQQREPTETAQ